MNAARVASNGNELNSGERILLVRAIRNLGESNVVVRPLLTILLGLGMALLLWVHPGQAAAQSPAGAKAARAVAAKASSVVSKKKPGKAQATPRSKQIRARKVKRRKKQIRARKVKRRKKRTRRRRRRTARRRASRKRRARKAPRKTPTVKKSPEMSAEAKLKALRRRHVGWLGRVGKKFPYWSKKLGPLRRVLAKARRAYWKERNDASVRAKYFKAAYRYLKKALLPYKKFRLKQARKENRREFTAKLQEQIAKIEARMAEFKQARK